MYVRGTGFACEMKRRPIRRFQITSDATAFTAHGLHERGDHANTSTVLRSCLPRSLGSLAAVGRIDSQRMWRQQPGRSIGWLGSQLATASSTVASNQVSLTIDSVSPREHQQRSARAEFTRCIPGRTHRRGFLTALTAICTHEQCTVTGFDNQRYVCPCPGSQYDTSGRVVNGPAPTALRTFPTQFSNSVLTFTV